jgi:hypothetical protein
MPRSLQYTGPITAATLKLPDGGQRDLMLHTGKVYTDLPEDNEYIAALIDLGHLAEVEAAPAEPAPKPEKPKKGDA